MFKSWSANDGKVNKSICALVFIQKQFMRENEKIARITAQLQCGKRKKITCSLRVQQEIFIIPGITAQKRKTAKPNCAIVSFV